MKKYTKGFILCFVLYFTVLSLVGCVSTTNTSNSRNFGEETESQLLPAYVYQGNDKKWGFIDVTGEFIIQPQYDETYDFTHNLAIVREKGFYGVVNKKGEYVLEPEFLYIQDIHDDVIVGIKNDYNHYRLYNHNGNLIKEVNGNISEFSEGIALFTTSNDWPNDRYGYLDTKGNILIEENLLKGTAFQDGVAVVQTEDMTFSVIDKKGTVLNIFQESIIGEISEGVLIYRDEVTSKVGYISINGEKITEAIFDDGNPFKDGLAEVMITDPIGNNSYGLINKDGDYVLEVDYNGIQVINEELYAINNSSDLIGRVWDDYVPKAILDQNGELISDYIYYQIGKVTQDIYYVFDGINSYITDQHFAPLPNFPELNGAVEITFINGIFKIQLDHELLYLSEEGKTIWQDEYTYPLANGPSIIKKKLRSDRFNLVYYPQLINHPNASIERDLNILIESIFLPDDEKATDEDFEDYYQTIDKDFEVNEIGELLTIVEKGYLYFLGGAHGTPWIKSHHININTGEYFTLNDLFLPDSNYLSKLEAIVLEQIEEQQKEDPIYFEWASPTVTDQQFFLLTDEGLEIYYQVYEIASYAVGMPSFFIPYEEVMDLLNTDGSFWKSLDI
ncbi:WG repeat-containing protein [Alkaliphilus transvaalensis]|uniref:WG repeat-containing protein n=1 Tax=Alkaliphilus transvaalensis TaxID=114628 RepID=UPI0004792C4D|nr:WG repeat-containing protein [Alkaliphilus transvaalensis]